MSARAVTIIPRTWEFKADELDSVVPRLLLAALLAALYAQGAAKAYGWLDVVIHGEWDPIGQVYRLHVHG